MDEKADRSGLAVAVIQARMASSRLPGKVMRAIGGRPMLDWVVTRTSRSAAVDRLVVATSDQPGDDPIAAYCREKGHACYRGSPFDVLDRVYRAAREQAASIVIRITADCPLIDPQLVTESANALWGRGAPGVPAAPTQFDFAANRLPPPWGRTYPIGLDVEACTFAALEAAWREAAAAHQREHVMPFLYENSDRFRIFLLHHERDYGHMRWTVDTPADLELVRQIVSRFPDDRFSWLQVVDLFEREPLLAEINADVAHKSVTDTDDRRG